MIPFEEKKPNFIFHNYNTKTALLLKIQYISSNKFTFQLTRLRPPAASAAEGALGPTPLLPPPLSSPETIKSE